MSLRTELSPPRLIRLLAKLVMMLVLASVFAWYFLGPVPFDLNQLWAFCSGR
jgi:hypothetical protein